MHPANQEKSGEWEDWTQNLLQINFNINLEAIRDWTNNVY